MTGRALRLALLGVAGAYVLAVLALVAARAGYPFELEWIEGASLQQVRRVLAGKPLYVAPSLEFTPLLYTPLYTYVSAAASTVLGSGFLPLRLVSIGASFGTAVLVFRAVRPFAANAGPAFLAAALYGAAFRASGAWMDVARVDALFVFLLLATTAVLEPRGEDTRTTRPALAGLLLTAAVLTKQTGLVAAVVLCASVLVVGPRRRAVAFLGTFLVTTAAAFAILDQSSAGWFRYYVFGLAGRHHLAPVMLVLFWTQKVCAPLGVAVCAACVFLRSSTTPAAVRGFHAWRAAALIAVSLATHLTVGSYDNNLLPAHAALSILFGLGLATARRIVPADWEPLVTAACLVQFGALFYNPVRQVPTREDRAAGERVLRALSDLPGPVLVPRHPYLLEQAGKPGHAHEMTLADVLLDPGPVPTRLLEEVREALAARRFKALLLDDRFLLADEVERHYREDRRLFPDDAGGFWPVTGQRTRPNVVLLAR